MAEKGGRRRHKCRYGAECRLQDKPAHTARFWHPGEGELCPPCVTADAKAEDLSQAGDQHAGTKFPRMQCQYHPGCKMRWTCFYSHGLIHAVDDSGGVDLGVPTCFLGQAPHNQGCMNPTWNGEPYDFCSKECREMAKLTPKGPLSCRRHNCPCPCTVNGLAGQFCCKSCYNGIPCKYPTHTAPTAHLVVVAKPQKGRFAPCARENCACAVDGGSSWDGKPGQYCCRACRNGTPCEKLWHTEPESLRSDSVQQAYVGFTCAMAGCDEPTWNGREGEYCCFDHRHMAMGNYVPPDDEDEPEADTKKTEGQRLLEKVDVPRSIPFPNFAELWRHANGWAHSHCTGAHKGKLAKVWFNESLTCVGCPSRITFERAVQKSKCDDFRRGEFGWHGTKCVEAINGICWSNLDTARRSGQACGPGEYFSRGTQAGLNYSEGYAGGTAGNLLIVFWIMSHELGAAPTSPAVNGSSNGQTANHIVCQNPTKDGRISTGEMYCVPVAVVAFGSVITTPDFRTFNPNMKDPDVSDLLRKVQDKCQESDAKQSDKSFIQAEQLMLKKSEALLKNALEGTDVEALQAAIAQVQKHCLVDTSLLDKAQTMVGPKCIEQLEAASGSGSSPDSLQRAINVAEKLSASGGIFVEPALLQMAKDRFPSVKCEYNIRIAVETGDMAALRGAVGKAVEGLDPAILQEACQTLVNKTEEQLRSAMAGTDIIVLQKTIAQATTVDDGLPKSFSEEESNWLPAEGVPHLDDTLLDEARKRLVAMKYENGLSIVIQQVTDGDAPPIKLSNTIKQSVDIEGVNAELLDQARQLLAAKCNSALESSKASGDEIKMMAAVVLSDDISEVNGDLLAEVRQSAMESCENKIKAAEAQLNDSCDSSVDAVQLALANAQRIQTLLEEILGVCQDSSVFEDVSQRLVFDESLVQRARGRQTVLVYEEALKTMISRVAEGTDHVSNLKFWTDQSAALSCLVDVDPEMISQSQAAMKESCDSKLQAALESVELLDSLTALSWSTGIDGLDEALLEAVTGLIASRCKDMVAEHEQALQDTCGGDDLASLEGAIANAAGLPDVLPTDPNLGWLARAPAILPEQVEQALSDAKSVAEALPPAWGPAEGKLRVREELLNETRQRLLVDATLLGDARHRVVVLKSEAELRTAAAGDDLTALQASITASASVEGVNKELLAEAKQTIVQKSQGQIQAACDSGDVMAIQAKLDQVSAIEGVDASAVENAQALMIKICEDGVRSKLSERDPVMLRQAIATAEAVKGVTPSLLQEARASATAWEAELQLNAATKLRDVANLKTVLAKTAGVAGVDPSIINTAKQTLTSVCEEEIKAALNLDDASDLRRAIAQAESVENVDSLLMEEARKRLEVLEKPKSLCCTIS